MRAIQRSKSFIRGGRVPLGLKSLLLLLLAQPTYANQRLAYVGIGTPKSAGGLN